MIKRFYWKSFMFMCLCESEFFSDNQWVSSDGAFEGDR
jgi:hypothetical protein